MCKTIVALLITPLRSTPMNLQVGAFRASRGFPGDDFKAGFRLEALRVQGLMGSSSSG